MGCGSSAVKVEASHETVSPTKNKRNSVSPEKNKIRGDRLSMIDARLRREEESKEHRRKLSLRHKEQVNQATQRNSHVDQTSSRRSSQVDQATQRNSHLDQPSSRRRSSVASFPKGSSFLLQDENKIPEHKSTEPAEHKSTEQNGTIHTNGFANKEIKADDTRHDSIQPFSYTNSDSEVKVNQTVQKRKSKISDIQEYPDSNLFIPAYDEDTSPKKQIIFAESTNKRNSVTSLELKSNADSIVGDIMAQAILTVENDETRCDNISSNSKRTSSAVSGASSTVVDEHAKDIVFNVLSNALFQVESEISGDVDTTNLIP